LTCYSEADLEDLTLAWLAELGYEVLCGPDILPGEPNAERKHLDEGFLPKRLRSALRRINTDIPPTAIDDAVRKMTLAPSPSLIETNHTFHTMLRDGIDVQYRTADGRDKWDKVWPIDFSEPANNDWTVVHQLSVVEGDAHRRADIVVYVNGLPLAVIELKNPSSEEATVRSAHNQLRTYQHEIPSLFHHNEVMVASDGLDTRAAPLTAEWEWWLPWKTVEGDEVSPAGMSSLEVAVRGIFEHTRFLDIVRNFVVFESNGGALRKKMALYHQYHAVNAAVESTIDATSAGGDKRAGVVWHTQGSGKSLTMAFYAGKLIEQPEMENPTVVVLTDRRDLDDQLYGTFSRCQELLRQQPLQADDRENLRDLLQRAAGGVIFTTLQKFLPEKGEQFPCMSERRNIVVIADEAHRSHYGFIDGFAKHLRDAVPNASFIAFTGTPIELVGRDTRQVFGDYIDVYDIRQAVEDGATVPIYYEGRLVPLDLTPDAEELLDEEFDEITEDEETDEREELKRRWSRLEKLVGTEARLQELAEDLVEHFETRQEVIEGKGMVVCMSRRICVELYNEIVKLRPAWRANADDEGAVKVVMTGSASDPVEWQQHIRSRARRDDLARRFKDPDDPFQLVLVRDMWLTGFDAPPLHTMYIDKPMQGHTLMQAIARVNRVFRDKPGGLVVDYLGIADKLKRALEYYSESDREATGIDQSEAVAILLEEYEIVSDMFHGFDYSAALDGTLASLLPFVGPAVEHILALEDGEDARKRFMEHVSALSKAFALAVPHEDALAIREEVGFFQAVRAGLVKLTKSERDGEEDVETAIQQLVSRSVVSGDVIDIFSEAGLEKPDLSVLSDEFLAEVRGMEHKNLAAEALRKLLERQIRTRERKNPLEASSFAEKLRETILCYRNRTIKAAEVIEELIGLAHEIRDADRRGEEMGLTDDELAFYDALAQNESAVEVMGDEQLRVIARELLEHVRENATIDWSVRESTRAKLRVICKRILRKHGYPPDLQESATHTVLRQAERLCEHWVAV